MFKPKRFMLLNNDPNPGGGNVPPAPPAPASPAQPAAPEPAGIDPLAFYAPPAPPPAPAPAAPAAPAEPQQPAAPAQQEPSSLVGYGTPPAAPAPPVPAPAAPAAPADPAAPPAAPVEPPADPYAGLVVEGLAPEDATALKDFAKVNNLSAEAAQSFVNLKKEEIRLQKQNFETAKAAHQAKIKAQQDQWGANLRSQWGSNFDSNLHMTEKYIREFMPETNKWLTESKTMVPDYVMRDFYARAKEAYSTAALPAGAGPDSVGSESYDPLDFYKQK